MVKKHKKNKLLNLNNKNLILFGAIGSLFFILSWLIQGAYREGYNPMKIPISSLAIGSLGWIQIISFIITGIMIILFALALLKITKKEYKGVSIWGPILIAICGIGLIGAGIFVTDPINGYPPGTGNFINYITFIGILHQIFAAFMFLSIPLACIVFGNHFAQKKELKMMIYSFLSGIIFLIMFLLYINAIAQIGGLESSLGLIQRITLFTGFLWIAIVSIYYYKK